MSLLRNVRTFIGLGPELDPAAPIVNSSRFYGDTDKDPKASAVATVVKKGAAQVRLDDVDEAPAIDLRDNTSTRDISELDASELDASKSVKANPLKETNKKAAEVQMFDDADNSYSDDYVEAKPLGGNRASDSKVVRSLASQRAKPRLLTPTDFAEAKDIADEFKRDIPIVVNLNGLERKLSRRLIDFCSGLCYGSDGTMEKVSRQVFLLTPHGIEISDSDRLKIETRSYAR